MKLSRKKINNRKNLYFFFNIVNFIFFNTPDFSTTAIPTVVQNVINIVIGYL